MKAQPMAEIRRLEAGDLSIGAVLITSATGRSDVARWQSKDPVPDAAAMGKALAASLLQALLDAREVALADGTNWPSVAAACAAHVRAWSARLSHPERRLND